MHNIKYKHPISYRNLNNAYNNALFCFLLYDIKMTITKWLAANSNHVAY